MSPEQRGVQYFLKNSHKVSIQTQTSVWITAVFRKQPLSKWTIIRPAVRQVRGIVAGTPAGKAKGDTSPPTLPPTQFPWLLHARANLPDHSALQSGMVLGSQCQFQPCNLFHSPTTLRGPFPFLKMLLWQSHRCVEQCQLHPPWCAAVASVPQIRLCATCTSVQMIPSSTSLLQQLCPLFPLPSKMQKVVSRARLNPATGKPTV